MVDTDRMAEISGADPFLTGEAAYETIIGMQSTGVQAWYVRICLLKL